MKYVKVEFKIPLTSKVTDVKHLADRVRSVLIGDERITDLKVSAGSDDLNEFVPKDKPKNAGQHQ